MAEATDQRAAGEETVAATPGRSSLPSAELSRHVYAPEYLLSFQQQPNCRVKPEGLQDLTDILPGHAKPKGGQHHGKAGTQRPPRHEPRGQGTRDGAKEWRRESDTASATAPIPATTDKNVWQRPKRADGKDKMLRDVIGILNKLTPEKFEPLRQQLVELISQVTDVSILEDLINQIFDRALSEPQFSKMYAQLCHSIREVCPKFERDGKQVNFKQLLLNRCQKEFEKEVSANEQALHESKERARMFGNVIFIGELFKLGLLTDKIMHTCIINALLPEQPTEEKLEAFCKLMSTVGKQLDTQAKAPHRMTIYFRRLEDMKNQKNLSSRIRFMLTDLIDMRGNGWVGVGTDNTPKKIEEVHKMMDQTVKTTHSARLGQTRSLPAPATTAAPPAVVTSVSGAAKKGDGDGWELPSKRNRGRGNKTGSTESVNRKNDKLNKATAPTGPSSRGRSRGGQQRGGRGLAPVRLQKAQHLSNSFALLDTESEDDDDEKAESFSTKRGDSTKASTSSLDHQEALRVPQDQPPNDPTNTNILTQDTAKKLDQDIELLLDEYLMNDDVLDAGECIKDLNAPEYHHKVVFKALVKAIEGRTDRECQLVSKLLVQLLHDHGILSPSAIAQGFVEVLQVVNDIDLDSPKASTCLGGMIGQAVVFKVLPLSFLDARLDHLVASGKALKILSEFIRVIGSQTKPSEMNTMFSEAGIDFKQFLPEDRRSLDFLQSYLREQLINVDLCSTFVPVS